MKNESESERGSGLKRGVFQRRSRGGAAKDGKPSGSTHKKHYAKMGLVFESPTKETTPPHALRVVSESVDVGVEYEVVRVEGGGDVEASPPISVKSESVGSGGEGPTSSPDSGYGNTPDNPGGEDNLAGGRTSSNVLRPGPGRRPGASNETKRVREGTQDSAYGMDPSSEYGNEPGSYPTTSPRHLAGQYAGLEVGEGPPHRTTPTTVSGNLSVTNSNSKEILERQEMIGQMQSSSRLPSVSSLPPHSSLPHTSFPHAMSVPVLSSLPRGMPPPHSSLPHSASPPSKRRRGRTTSNKQFSKSTGLGC